MARSILLITVGFSLFLCAALVAAQEPAAPWPVFPNQPPAQSPTGSRLIVERLPSVEPYGSIVSAYPPLLGPWISVPVLPAPVDAAATTTDDTASEQEGGSDKKDDKEAIPDIPGDPLPRMFETVVIEKTPLYNLDVPWLDPWSGSFELGMDGSAGNSNTFNIRLGANAKRKTKRHSLTFDLDYHKNTNDAVETVNRFNFDGRYERLSETKPWTWFFQQTTNYDEFQPWNVRVVASGGVGYRLIDDEITSLTTRLGTGFSQEVGGPDQDCIPEMNYGVEYEHQMTKRQKMAFSVEYFPNIASYNEFRLVSKADWSVLLNEENNLSLKLSAIDRYNYPNPGGQLNDIDYAIVLLWSF